MSVSVISPDPLSPGFFPVSSKLKSLSPLKICKCFQECFQKVISGQTIRDSPCSTAQSCLTLCDPMEPARFLCPWDFPGKNTGVGYHFLLQGNLPNPWFEPTSPALQADSFTTEPPGKPSRLLISQQK